jgi:hypothetical protein
LESEHVGDDDHSGSANDPPPATSVHAKRSSQGIHGFFAIRADSTSTVKTEEMNVKQLPHKHVPVVRHELHQRGGIPYEVERKVCSACARVLDERPLRRAAA